MTKAEILAELELLTPADREEIRARINELDGEIWDDDELTEEEKASLIETFDDMKRHPEKLLSWEEVQKQVFAKLQK